MDTQYASIQKEIEQVRASFGDTLCIVGHHYQAQEIVDQCDIRGDSLELARKITDISAKHIIFCGVYFMGESAALLAREGQYIYLPDRNAECVMAQTAPALLVERVLTRLTAKGRKIIPIAYVNSSLAVKAVAGKFGGTVCTSANAEKVARWAQDRGDALLFLPDRNLGLNTAAKLGILPEETHILNITGNGERVDTKKATHARMLLWPGCCAVHNLIHPEHIEYARRKNPGCLVAAHPECNPAVVHMCDRAGSTTALIQVVRDAKPGETVYVGTELNLVERLTQEAALRGVTVIPLRRCVCSNMAKITPIALLNTLKNIRNGTEKPVLAASDSAEYARIALHRMLAIGH